MPRMKRRYYRYCKNPKAADERIPMRSGIFRCFLLLVILLGYNKPCFSGENKPYFEKIYLHTDRNYYISGENIQFKAYLSAGKDWEVKSRILYVEIGPVNSSTTEVFSYLVKQNNVIGSLELPDSLKSGSYLLRAYTNWHKNFEYRYAFSKDLLVINRFGRYGDITGDTPDSNGHDTLHSKPAENSLQLADSAGFYFIDFKPGKLQDPALSHWEIYSQGQLVFTKQFKPDEEVSTLKLEKADLPDGLLKIIFKSENLTRAYTYVVNDRRNVKLSIKPEKEIYNSRSPVNLLMELEGDSFNFLKTDLSISVYSLPENEAQAPEISITEWIKVYSEVAFSNQQKTISAINPDLHFVNNDDWLFDEPVPKKLIYPLETEGRIISGRVINKITRKAIPDALIFFSFADTLSYLDYDRTDSNGYFYFSVPLVLDIDPGFIQIWDAPVETDQCQIILEEPNKPAIKNGSKILVPQGEYLTQLFSNQVKVFEISSAFQDLEPLPLHDSNSYELSSIYQGLCISVFPSNFIKLNNFSEIVKEILPGVRLKTGESGISLRIYDDIQNVYFDQDPLVLINGLPFRNYNYLAALNSDDIVRVDVVRKQFAVGSIIFPGVLSVTLKDLLRPSYYDGNKLTKVRIQTSKLYNKLNFPIYNEEAEKLNRRPDFRNTLYWIPNLSMDSNQEQISFYTSDLPGKYRIRVEGLINGTIPVSASTDFQIENNY